MSSQAHIDGFAFDLDGTVYLGEKALPGAVFCLTELRRRGTRTVFVTNKPLESAGAYAQKLTGLGIPTPPEQVITSAFVLGRHLARHFPDLRYYVVGEQNLRNELSALGLQVVDELVEQSDKAVIDPSGIDAVIVAFDRTLDYRKLNTAYQALQGGARFFATNADKACPMPGGVIPDAGATVAALEHLTGRKLELLAGKPSALIMQTALELLGLPPGRCLMVGDRLETDIRMGKESGMRTALVLTGASRREDLAAATVQPDWVLENLGELPALLGLE
jgi:NagD protein